MEGSLIGVTHGPFGIIVQTIDNNAKVFTQFLGRVASSQTLSQDQFSFPVIRSVTIGIHSFVCELLAPFSCRINVVAPPALLFVEWAQSCPQVQAASTKADYIRGSSLVG
jgi:hypothetical protein